jgi:hypothetical protein
MNILLLAVVVCLPLQAAQLAGVEVDDKINVAKGTTLHLNGMGIRKKLWVEVYVGSLYLEAKSHDPVEVMGQSGPFRVQMDILYKEVTAKKLVAAWQDGFDKNQSSESLAKLNSRIQQFNALFSESALQGDRIQIDYTPAKGTRVIKNGKLLGTIAGADFRQALLAIWLGEAPADKGLKEGMLGDTQE